MVGNKWYATLLIQERMVLWVGDGSATKKESRESAAKKAPDLINSGDILKVDLGGFGSCVALIISTLSSSS